VPSLKSRRNNFHSGNVEEKKMEIRFIGPLDKVTGSCTWMRDQSRGWSFLVDCGMQQGERSAKDWNACEDWPFQAADLQFVLLTHAHIDHSGLIPVLYRRGFKGTIYCTEETQKLAELLLRDAARFPDAPYSENDLELIKWRTPGGATKFGIYHPVDQDLFIRFFRSGHIVGAASVSIHWGPKGDDQKSIVFSGDVGPGSEDGEVLPFLRYPLHPKPGNFAVLESTYGSVVREESERSPTERRAQLKKLLDRILESGGTLALPAFSVGRTQDILFDIHYLVAENAERYGAIKYLLDSPTSAKVNAVTLEALKKTQLNPTTGKSRPLWMGKQVFRELGLDKNNREHFDFALDICSMTLGNLDQRDVGGRFGNSVAGAWRPLFKQVKDRARQIQDENGPRVILMSSGTGDGGACASWLPALIQSERNIVALAGYCAATTVGGQLLTLMRAPIDQRKLHTGEIVWKHLDGSRSLSVPISHVRASITCLKGYSAHGDQTDLVNWLFENHRGNVRQVLGRTVFLQHGESKARNALQEALYERACDWDLDLNVVKPRDATRWFNLDLDQVHPGNDLSPEEIQLEIGRLQHALASLKAVKLRRNGF